MKAQERADTGHKKTPPPDGDGVTANLINPN